MVIDNYKYWLILESKNSRFRKIKKYKTLKGLRKGALRFSKKYSEVVDYITIYKQITQCKNNQLDKMLLLKELEKEE
jgi:hypothetical protein